MYVSKLVRALEGSGLLQRADHPGDPRAFQLELTEQGADLAVKAAMVVRELYDQLLSPIDGRSSKRHAALLQTLEALLDHAEALNRPKAADASETSRPIVKTVRKRRRAS